MWVKTLDAAATGSPRVVLFYLEPIREGDYEMRLHQIIFEDGVFVDIKLDYKNSFVAQEFFSSINTKWAKKVLASYDSMVNGVGDEA
jgi:hypothetical protein